MKTFKIFIFLLLFYNVLFCESTRPKIGLVLSGGGARGFAHIGVLKVLEKHRIPVDCIAGTSMGAIIGGLYAAGVSPEEMEKEMNSIKWKEIFSNRPSVRNTPPVEKQNFQMYPVELGLGLEEGRVSLPKGFLEGEKIELVLDILLSHLDSNIDFDQLPIRFRAIATDIETGEMKSFSSGNLSKVLRASMSIPGVFLPVEIDGRLYVDGGIVKNLPVDIVKKMGVDVVIAVNTGSPLMKKEQLNSFVDVSFQVLALFGKMNDSQQLSLLDSKDILIVPDLEKINLTNFENVSRIIEAGIQTAEREVKRLSLYSVSEQEYSEYKNNLLAFRNQKQEITSIVIRNDSSIFDTVISHRTKIKPNEKLNKELLKDTFDRIYGLGVFESVDFSIEKGKDGKIFVIETKKKSWGTDSLSFGFGIFDDFHVKTDYTARLAYLKREINGPGGIWKNEVSIGKYRSFSSSLYQPLSYSGNFFIVPSIGIKSATFNTFDSGRRTGEYDKTVKEVGLKVGFQAERYLSFTAEISAGNIDVSPLIGPNSLQKYKGVKSDIVLGIVFDSLDMDVFPSDGMYLGSVWQHAWNVFGGDNSYDKIQSRLLIPFSRRRHSFVFNLESGTNLATQIPFYDKFSLGGFFNLSGVPYDYYRCDSFTKVAGVYKYKFHMQPPLYFGFSIEGAEMKDIIGYSKKDDFRIAQSIFFVAETIFGPFYLGYGKSGDKSSFYLFLGNP